MLKSRISKVLRSILIEGFKGDIIKSLESTNKQKRIAICNPFSLVEYPIEFSNDFIEDCKE